MKRAERRAHYESVETHTTRRDQLQTLVDRFLVSGDEAAIEHLVHNTRPRLLAAARRVGRASDAEDAVQVAYLSLIRKRGQRLEAPVLGWLLVATLRVAYRKKAAHRRQRAIAEQLSLEPAHSTRPVGDESREVIALLRARVADLPHRYRDAMYLHYLAGLAQEDVARLLDLPMATLRTRLHRGRNLLRGTVPPRVRAALCFGPWWLLDRLPEQMGLWIGGLVSKKATAWTALLAAVLLGGYLVVATPRDTEPDAECDGTVLALGAGSTANLDSRGMERAPELTGVGSSASVTTSSGRTVLETWHGMVVDPRGTPIAGARVEVKALVLGESGPDGTPPPSAKPADLQSIPRRQLAVQTNAKGEFAFPRWGVEAPWYATLLVSTEAYLPTRYRAVDPGPHRILVGKNGRLSVRVLDARSRPAKDIQIKALSGHVSMTTYSHAAARAMSDESGRATLDLPAGRYNIVASGPGLTITGKRGVLVRSNQIHELELGSGKGTTWTFEVVDQDNRPLAGARVRLAPSGASFRASTTDEAGQARFHDMPLKAPHQALFDTKPPSHSTGLGYFLVEIDGFAPHLGSSSLSIEGENIHRRVQMVPATEVRVRVVDDGGNPVPGADVYASDGHDMRSPFRTVGHLWSTRTNDQGVAQLNSLAEGTVRTATIFTRNQHGHAETTTTLQIDLRKQHDYEVVLTRRDRVLHGRLLGTRGQPLAGAQVGWGPSDWPGPRSVARNQSTQTDARGNFTLSQVSRGLIRLWSRVEGEWFQMHEDDRDRGSPEAPLILLRRDARSVRGFVRQRDGTAVANLELHASISGTVDQRAQTAWSIGRFNTDDTGQFVIRGIEDDTPFRVHLVSKNWIFAGSMVTTIHAREAAWNLTVKPAAEKHGMTVRVRVSADGAPYNGPLGLSRDEGGGYLGGRVGKPADGVHTFKVSTKPGTYDLKFHAPGFLHARLEGLTVHDQPPDRVRTWELTLHRGGEVQITVFQGAGEPLSNRSVTIGALRGNRFVARVTTTTDEVGHCTLSGLRGDDPVKLDVRLAEDHWTWGEQEGVRAQDSVTMTLRRYGSVLIETPWTYGKLGDAVEFRLVGPDGEQVDAQVRKPGDMDPGRQVYASFAITAAGTYRVECDHGGRRWTATLTGSPGTRSRGTLR